MVIFVILTVYEAGKFLKLNEPFDEDEVLLELLLSIDRHIEYATGFDFGTLKKGIYTSINPVAKQAARMLLVQWYDNPELMGNMDGVVYLIAQLKPIARRLSEAVKAKNV